MLFRDEPGGIAAVQTQQEEGYTPLPTHREVVRRAVESTLRQYLQERMATVEGLDKECARALAEPLVESTVAKGRRMRSVLAWWGWRAAGGTDRGARARAALRACASIELLHTFALTHDDLMDGATVRRGAASCHRAHADSHRHSGYVGDPERYGTSMAILSGDLALCWADDLLHESLHELGNTEAHEVWRDLRTEVMVGQFLDLRSQARGERDESAALKINRLKTASYSVEHPLNLGATMAGADARTVSALRGYGTDVGVAFQLRDDLQDAFGDPEHTGRPTGEDLREGKNTVLLTLGLQLAKRSGDRKALQTLRAVGHGEPAVAEAADALDRVGAREHVSALCAEFAAAGVKRLEGLVLLPEVEEGLTGFARTAGSA